jgi:hypothetical protein
MKTLANNSVWMLYFLNFILKLLFKSNSDLKIMRIECLFVQYKNVQIGLKCILSEL